MRVMTWNVWWRFGPWRERREALLTVLSQLRPDAVGLQEVWEERGGENLAGWLADELGMHWTWEPSPEPEGWQRRVGDDSSAIGNAVLSRWPVAERAATTLPSDRNDGRLALYALLDRPGARVPFFTTHLTSAPDASGVRCEQVRALVPFLDRCRTASPYPTDFPVVLTGDHNAWPDSDEMRLLGGYRTAPVVPGRVLLDAWEYAEPGAPAATWDPSNPYVGPDPAVRVDHVHVGPPGPGGLGHVRAVRRAGHGPVGGVWPSDHAAVLADLADGDEDDEREE
ncbi:endonuclease/exonuclease/phosphatase family protein [Streptomyces sp. NPDC048172]|uniref:endonuclease/exonuclease/phosphatase family protein n=1 Tax=Streptomyces sp. NPDC048172 TaxID=3365505 RepID=UPI00371D0E34